MAYKVIDLFAGAGGLSLGFMQTGNLKLWQLQKTIQARERHINEITSWLAYTPMSVQLTIMS